MIVDAPAPEWDEVEDRELLAQFLQTRTGQRLVPKVVESVPALLDGGNVNEILIRSGEVRGWQAALRTLLSLAVIEKQAPQEPVNPSYPAPDDDAAWNDGQKVNP